MMLFCTFLLLCVQNIISTSKKIKSTECLKPSGTNVIDLSESQVYEAEKKYYGCNLQLNNRVDSNLSLVYLYSCTFNHIISNTLNGGAIYIFNKGDGTPTGNNTIDNCVFNDCQALNGGALFAETQQHTRFYNIKDCTFTNNQAQEGGGAIYFKAAFSNIDGCKFINNKAGTKGSDFYFLCNEQSDKENPLLIQYCSFERTTEISTQSMILLDWNKKSDLYFENNQVYITTSNKIYFIESVGDLTLGNLSFALNCISPSKEYLCDSTNTALYNKVSQGFSSTCKNVVCPEPPSKDYIEITKSQVYEADNRYYGCNLRLERVDSNLSIIYLYSCTFNHINSNTLNGGAIYIFNKGSGMPSGNSTIDSCSFNDCQALNGGALFVETEQSVRFYNIKDCTFTNNQAQEGGGAIYFKAAFSNIDGCKFINNKAGTKGSELYYECYESQDYERPLLIQYCSFERTSTISTPSMIFLDWNKKSDLFFESNDINITSSNKVYLFESTGNLAYGNLSAQINCISPSKENLCDKTSNEALYNKLEQGFSDTCNLVTCPGLPTQNYLEIKASTVFEPGKRYYGCNLRLKRIDSNLSIIYLYSCTFNRINSNTLNGGAIYIFNKRDDTPSGNNTIDNCVFNDCQALNGGALFIETQQSVRFYNIKDCTFTNNQAQEGGGAIYFKAAFSNIDNCTFLNNRAGTKGGSELYYECYESQDYERPLLIQYCSFERTAKVSTPSMIFLDWNKKSDLFFENNKAEIISSSKIYLFESIGDLTLGNLSFTSNCISPSKEYICDQTNNAVLYNKAEIEFSDKCQQVICPALPNGYKNITEPQVYEAGKKYYGCNLQLNNRVDSNLSLVYLYSCTFNHIISNTLNGGAIYIFNKGDGTPTGNNTIDNCMFNDCQALNGGALFVETQQHTRFYNIKDCTFTNNQAQEGGGAIYFKAAFSNIDGCKFINNKAGTKGSDFYFLCNEQSDKENPLLIQYCSFERTTEISTQSMILLDWNKKSDLYFENNQVYITTSNKIYFIESVGDLTLGNLSFALNCISPSKEYLCDSTNTALYNKVSQGFSSTCKNVVCPEPPGLSYLDIKTLKVFEQGNRYYGCNLRLERVDSNLSIIYLYSCTFNHINSNTLNGGAIYIFNKGSGMPSGNSTIDSCSFNDCQALNGGALFIETQQSVRFYNIKDCTFTNNQAQEGGGAIYFKAAFSNIDGCTFLNNKASTKGGSEIYYQCNEQTDYERPLLIQYCSFERTSTISTPSLIFLDWNEKSDLFFENNKVDITSSSKIYLFESTGDITAGNLSASRNCISPDKEYICDSTNSALLNKLIRGFPYLCVLPDDIVLDDSNCTKDNRCQNIVTEEEYHHVTVIRSEFTSFEHAENGGAIYMVNCGLTCKGGVFTTCKALNGGGGGIFIYNDLDIYNNVNLTDLHFESCQASFGGAVYVYTKSEYHETSIMRCTFEKNEVISSSSSKLFGGSAVYLTTLNAEIIACSFTGNHGKGGALKINENFDEVPPKNNKLAKILTTQNHNIKGSIHISSCKFEINEKDQCSFYYAFGNKHIQTDVNDCTFTGKLAKNSYHVDGQSNAKTTPRINFQNCKFSSDSKHALNRSAFKIDMKNQVFNYGSNKNEILRKRVLISLATVGVFCIAVMSALIMKKKNMPNEIYDQTLINDEVQIQL